MTTLPSLHKRHVPLADPREQIARLHALSLPSTFDECLDRSGLHPLHATDVRVLQVNVGKQCNQTCAHCHVDAGPDRTEVMTRHTMEKVLSVLARSDIPVLDITGGAPELHPGFRWLVEEATALGRHVMDRCNLTILRTQKHEDLPEFLAEHHVEIVASLPYYQPRQTDAQRGDGVFARSIEALQSLNALGYGRRRDLVLNLVTNPVGAFLPASQPSLEREWKAQLDRRYGVVFNSLFTITNMPISRFLEFLIERGNLETYMGKLVQSFNPTAAQGVMCRDLLSVGWDGTLYDCDFNQMLELPMDSNAPNHIDGFDYAVLAKRRITTAPHCFGCTAGAGSSCGGAIAT